MKCKWKTWLLVALILAVAGLAFGCGGAGSSESGGTEAADGEAAADDSQTDTPPSIVSDSRELGIVTELDTEGWTMTMQRMEWVTDNDEERLTELGIDGNTLNNGYYLNDLSLTETYQLSEDVKIIVLVWGENLSEKEISRAELPEFIETLSYDFLCWVSLADGIVVTVSEQYRP